MSVHSKVLAVIPARGGSRGLEGKNVRPFLGIPLIAHTILFARMCPEIDRCIVSTDSPEIAGLAREFDADVPFMRPPELARDDTPIWPVLRHALEEVERRDGVRYDMLVLLDPTSPGRHPSDMTGALNLLRERPDADGIWTVSRPDFNPRWVCVVDRDGWMADLVEGASGNENRQQVAPTYRINGALYIWRTDFARKHELSWRARGRNLMYEIPESRAMSLDSLEEFERAELLARNGFFSLPWLSEVEA